MRHSHDIVLSYAIEDESIANALFDELTKVGITVYKFNKNDEDIKSWGENLIDRLTLVYQRGRYCVMLLSKHYLTKTWTNFERQVVQGEQLQRSKTYILPVKIGSVNIPTILPTVGYLNYDPQSPKQLAEAVIKKLTEKKSIKKIVSGVAAMSDAFPPPVIRLSANFKLQNGEDDLFVVFEEIDYNYKKKLVPEFLVEIENESQIDNEFEILQAKRNLNIEERRRRLDLIELKENIFLKRNEVFNAVKYLFNDVIDPLFKLKNFYLYNSFVKAIAFRNIVAAMNNELALNGETKFQIFRKKEPQSILSVYLTDEIIKGLVPKGFPYKKGFELEVFLGQNDIHDFSNEEMIGFVIPKIIASAVKREFKSQHELSDYVDVDQWCYGIG